MGIVQPTVNFGALRHTRSPNGQTCKRASVVQEACAKAVSHLPFGARTGRGAEASSHDTVDCRRLLQFCIGWGRSSETSLLTHM